LEFSKNVAKNRSPLEWISGWMDGSEYERGLNTLLRKPNNFDAFDVFPTPFFNNLEAFERGCRLPVVRPNNLAALDERGLPECPNNLAALDGFPNRLSL